MKKSNPKVTSRRKTSKDVNELTSKVEALSLNSSSRRKTSKVDELTSEDEAVSLNSSSRRKTSKVDELTSEVEALSLNSSSRRKTSKVDELTSEVEALSLGGELERVLSLKFDASTTLRYSASIRNFAKKIDNEKIRDEFIFQFVGQFMVTCNGDALIESLEHANEWWDTHAFDAFKQSVLDAIKMRTEGVKIEKCDLQCRNRLCRSDKCVFFLQQTRSADEGMTAFVLCTKCSTRYRLG